MGKDMKLVKWVTEPVDVLFLPAVGRGIVLIPLADKAWVAERMAS